MDFEGTFFNTEDFQLQKKSFAEGVFGKVYIAKNINDNKDYAVKILNPKEGFNGHQQMLFMRESTILQNLNHPAIISFKGINFQSFKDPTKLEPSIITEYQKNGSLKKALDKERKAIANSKWDSTKKYITLLGITNAMKYLHEHNIIHRDLKPENVLMDENFYPKICDFGLSRCLPHSINEKSMITKTTGIGTPLYMSPELLKGKKHYDSSVDVYAFSMLAYEIITGKIPFYEIIETTNAYALGIKVIDGYRPKWPKFVPKKTKELISKCWDDNPRKRPTFAKIYSKLSSDFSYFNEDVDEDEIQLYIDILDDQTTQETPKSSTNDHHPREYSETEDDDEEETKELKVQLKNNQPLDDYYFDALNDLFGNKDEYNPKEAIFYLQKSSSNGNGYSSYLLGLLYQNGSKVNKDFTKSMSYFELAGNQGNLHGFRRIGFCCYQGYDTKRNYSLAVKYYQIGCEHEDPRSINSLGRCYQNGKGVEQSFQKAFDLYKRAADLGSPYAMNNLGKCYECGFGCDRDYNIASQLYQKAAELGESYGFNNLALMYEKGLGVNQNITKAIELYHAAIDIGNPDAHSNLKNLQKKSKK